MNARFDVIVIGSGITGLTAAKRLAERGVSVANIEAEIFGGLVINVNELAGEPAGSGADLASALMMEAGELGCVALSERVASVDVDADGVRIATDAGEHRARALIVASGAKLKRLGVPGEAELAGRGVSQCADCDGPMYQGQDVTVVGGGDSALQEAQVLSRYCANVRVVHHGAQLTAAPAWIRAIERCTNVTVEARSEVVCIDGEDAVRAAQVRSLRDGSIRTIPCAAVFVYVGLAPASDYLGASVRRDSRGAVVTDEHMQTTVEGVFAAGAVRAGYAGTLADAVAEAEAAAAAALKRLGS